MKKISKQEFASRGTENKTLLTVRIDPSLLKKVDNLALFTGKNRSFTVRELIELGLNQIQ